MTLAVGRFSTRVIPSVTSARYAPGPGMAMSSRECSVPWRRYQIPVVDARKTSVSLLQSPNFSLLVSVYVDGGVHDVEGFGRQMRVARGGTRTLVAKEFLDDAQRHAPL